MEEGSKGGILTGCSLETPTVRACRNGHSNFGSIARKRRTCNSTGLDLALVDMRRCWKENGNLAQRGKY